jgi:NtrC-family two-component system sensor histidine kinase KinB
MKNLKEDTTQTSLELLYHVSREIAATLDLKTVLQRILFLSMQNIGAVSGSIIALDENISPVASIIIHEKRIIEQTNKQLNITLEKGIAGWVVRNAQAVLIPDTSLDDRWLIRPDDTQITAGGKSVISVPFIARGKATGVITLVYRSPNFFKPENLNLVQAIADLAAVAVLNARLYAESQRQAHVMTTLANCATALTVSLKREDVFQQVLEQTRHAIQVEAVSLAMIDYNNNEIVFKASTSPDSQNISGVRMPLGLGIAGWVAQSGEGTIVQNVHRDPRFFAEIDQITGFVTSAIACAPIRFSEKIIGVIEAINPINGTFDSDALVVLTGIGSMAGSVIQHAQHFSDLQSAHERYHDLFERNINSMLITNWDGLILEANRESAQLFGYTQENLQTLKIDQLHKFATNKLGDGFSNLSLGETITYETVIRAKNNLELPAEVRVHAIQADSSSYLQWFFRSIQERKELDQLRDDLLSSIYHDLRSPLSNVISSLDVLENMLTLDNNPAILSLFNIAVRSTERIQRLTNSLLDINRLEAGQPVGNLKYIEPQVLVNDALEAVAPIAENKNQEISTDITDNLPLIKVDGDMIRRVLINLTENAVKYTPPGGRIKIGACQEGKLVLMWVEDTGPGIPPENRMNIFEKFTRLHGQNGPAGFGFGLAYCRLAIEGHAGRIWIEDTKQPGARFIFTLPTDSLKDY